MADYKPILPLFREKEGGLSRDPADRASADPSPCVIDGQKGWHTNKGVTWTTFKAAAPKLGFKADCTTFKAMPDAIWVKIFKAGYWNPWGLDNVKSNPVAWTIVWWSWGSGVGGAKSSLEKFLRAKGVAPAKDKKELALQLDRMAARDGLKLFNELREHRLKFYASLPSASAHLKGWTNAYNRFTDFVRDNAPAAPAASGGLLLASGLFLGIAAYRRYRNAA